MVRPSQTVSTFSLKLIQTGLPKISLALVFIFAFVFIVVLLKIRIGLNLFVKLGYFLLFLKQGFFFSIESFSVPS